jgi:hypothetical protein
VFSFFVLVLKEICAHASANVGELGYGKDYNRVEALVFS